MYILGGIGVGDIIDLQRIGLSWTFYDIIILAAILLVVGVFVFRRFVYPNIESEVSMLKGAIYEIRDRREVFQKILSKFEVLEKLIDEEGDFIAQCRNGQRECQKVLDFLEESEKKKQEGEYWRYCDANNCRFINEIIEKMESLKSEISTFNDAFLSTSKDSRKETSELITRIYERIDVFIKEVGTELLHAVRNGVVEKVQKERKDL